MKRRVVAVGEIAEVREGEMIELQDGGESPMGDLVEQVTGAVRAHYDGKIAALADERDEKIRQLTATLRNGPAPGTVKQGKPADRTPKRPRKEGQAERPTGKGRGEAWNALQVYALTFEREFSSAEIQEKFPDMETGSRSQALRNLVKRGELKLVTAGRGRHHPARYAPLPFNSLRKRAESMRSGCSK